jgi:hypothetical protein
VGRIERSLAEAEPILLDWHPDLAVVEMDDESAALQRRVDRSATWTLPGT